MTRTRTADPPAEVAEAAVPVAVGAEVVGSMAHHSRFARIVRRTTSRGVDAISNRVERIDDAAVQRQALFQPGDVQRS